MQILITNLIHDLRFTLRQYRRKPAFALTAVLVLALGFGSSTAAFSVLYQILLKPLPYPDAHQLLMVHNSFPKRAVAMAGVSGYDYAELRSDKNLFADAGVFYWNDLTLTGVGLAHHLDVVNASASFFNVFGMRPQLGRVFSESEDQRGAPGTAVLSDGLWRSDFGADPHVLGRTIQLDGAPYRVIGVMPRSFQFPSPETQLWIPVALPAGEFSLAGGRLEKWLHMVARLRSGITLQGAEAGLRNVSARLGGTLPQFYPVQEGWQYVAKPIAEEQTEHVRRWLFLAFGAALAVLMIACINVSGLLLIRGTARSGEMAVRRAMGATRGRVIAQVLTETSVLALSGCALGTIFSSWAIHLVNAYGPLPQPSVIGSSTLLFALAIALASTLLVGFAPSLFSAQLPVEQALKSNGTRTATKGSAARYGIVVAQIAFAVALLFTAVQLNRSFLNLTREPAGFNPTRLWTGSVTLPSRHYTEAGSWNARFFEPLLQQLRALPAVASASGTNGLPFNPSGTWTEEFRLPERLDIRPKPEAQIGLAFPGYFETMGIALLRGRTFTERDRVGTEFVAVIDEELAQRYFGVEDPLGKHIASGGADHPARIVGVVGSVHNSSLGGPKEPEVYYPEFQERSEAAYLALRIKNDTDPSDAVRQAIAKLDSDVALFDVKWMNERIAESLSVRRFIAALLNGLAGMGLMLAIVGLYGSLARLVELRQREIGIRMALGAMRSQMFRMVLLRAATVVMLGLAGGIAASAITERAIRTQLWGVELTDAATWAAVGGSIVVAFALAASFPAWRAAGIEPSVALRNE